jgi:hypothetical protein
MLFVRALTPGWEPAQQVDVTLVASGMFNFVDDAWKDLLT